MDFNGTRIAFDVAIKENSEWKDKTCFLCGEYFESGDEVCLLIPPEDVRKNAKKHMKKNQCMHKEELESLCTTITTLDQLYDVLDNHKKKRAKPLTEEQVEKSKLFIEAARYCNFHDGKLTKTGCTCKRRGSSDVLRFNARTERIKYSNRRKDGLFSGFAERQLVTNVYNKYHELLGDGIKSDYNALETIAEVINSVNNIMN